MEFGSFLLNRDHADLAIPDYSTIFASEYDDKAVKLMVLGDLKVVLQARMIQIDSLVAEKKTELALMARLDEFQQDLI